MGFREGIDRHSSSVICGTFSFYILAVFVQSPSLAHEKASYTLHPSIPPVGVITSAGLLSGRRRGGVPVALQAAFVMAGGLAIAYLMYHVVKLK